MLLVRHHINPETTYASFEEAGIMDELCSNGNFEIVKKEKEELTQFKKEIEAERVRKEEKINMAKKMLKKKELVSKITEYTGLSRKQVEKLA